MKRSVALALASSVAFASCNQGKIKDVFSSDEDVEEDSVEAYVGDTLHLFEEELPPVAVDELFDDFFFNFAGDARFQKQRIRFPLKFIDGEEVEKLTRDDWAKYNHFDSQEVYSVIFDNSNDMELQKDTAVSQVVVDWINFDRDSIDKFNFKRLDGKWVLMNVEKKSFDDTNNGAFLKFYSKFMVDSVYQRESLSESIKLVLTPQYDDEEEQVEELTVDQWFEMRSDVPFPKDALMNIDYGQSSDNQDFKTLQMEGVSNGFNMTFKFSRNGEHWKLVEIVY